MVNVQVKARAVNVLASWSARVEWLCGTYCNPFPPSPRGGMGDTELPVGGGELQGICVPGVGVVGFGDPKWQFSKSPRMPVMVWGGATRGVQLNYDLGRGGIRVF